MNILYCILSCISALKLSIIKTSSAHRVYNNYILKQTVRKSVGGGGGIYLIILQSIGKQRWWESRHPCSIGFICRGEWGIIIPGDPIKSIPIFENLGWNWKQKLMII